MSRRDPDPQVRARLLSWWIIWAALLLGLVIDYLGLVPRGPRPAVAANPQPLANLAGMVPLFVSIIIRWLVLPRSRQPARVFTLFVVGGALAELAGILGIVLGGAYRDTLFLLGVLGVAQFVPLFARQVIDPPADRFRMGDP